MKAKKKKISVFDIVNNLLVVLITVIVAYPLYFCIVASFSDPSEVVMGRTLLWFQKFTVEAYRLILKEEQLWTGYRNTIFYTLFGTLYNLVLTIPAAYVMSKKTLPFRGILSWYFFLTMYVNGGMIPTYILIKNLGLLNNPLVLVVGAGVSCYNLIVTRQYFSASITQDLYEAAYVDGAGEGRCFLSIALPLAKPIIAVMSLYYGVAHWNSYYNALLYIYKKDFYPLQLVLRNILINGQMSIASIDNTMSAEEVEYLIHRAHIAQGMKYAMVIVASIPLLIAYPFMPKYFEKGIMVGAVKG